MPYNFKTISLGQVRSRRLSVAGRKSELNGPLRLWFAREPSNSWLDFLMTHLEASWTYLLQSLKTSWISVPKVGPCRKNANLMCQRQVLALLSPKNFPLPPNAARCALLNPDVEQSPQIDPIRLQECTG